MFDFDPPANLESADYSNNSIDSMENIHKHRYLKNLILDNNNISEIKGLTNNKFLRMLSLNNNNIDTIENMEGLGLEELFLADNNISVICIELLPLLRRLDLSKNNISKLKGLESVYRLKFLYLSHNYISKMSELNMIENLQELTELDLCFNFLQNRKFYRSQVLFKIPQLRCLDGVEISCEEKIKSENLHGLDLNDRETIFKSILPEEKFIDRRINKIEDVEPESESDPENVEFMDGHAERDSQINLVEMSSVASKTMNEIVSKRGSMHSMGSRMSTNRANMKSGSNSDNMMGASMSNFTKTYVGEIMDKAAHNQVYGEF
jgi:Leucine-rich repeat (LRR) protein